MSWSKPGGGCGVTTETTDSSHSVGAVANVISWRGAATGAATVTGSALTNCLKTCVVHVLATGADRLQHPCGAFCDCESSNCGQEKQFPQNSAATTSPASSELENLFICP